MRLSRKAKGSAIYRFLSSYHNSPFLLERAIQKAMDAAEAFIALDGEKTFNQVLDYFNRHLVKTQASIFGEVNSFLSEN